MHYPFLILFFIYATNILSMETAKHYCLIEVADISTKIIACADSATKQALQQTCTTLQKRSSKNNNEVFIHSPLYINATIAYERMPFAIQKECIRTIANLLHCTIEKNINTTSRYAHLGSLLDYAFLIACREGKLNTFKFLYKKYSNYNINRLFSYRTLLHVATQHNQPKIVKEISSLPLCNVNYSNDHIHTPLYIAARYGYREIVKILLNNPRISVYEKLRHIDISPITFFGSFDAAVKNGSYEIIHLFLNHPQASQFSSLDMYNALYTACFNNHSTEIVTLLLTKEINNVDPIIFNQIRCPITAAVENGHLENVQLLCARAPWMIYNKQVSHSALFGAIFYGKSNCITYLLSFDSSLLNNFPALVLACNAQKINSVKTLLQYPHPTLIDSTIKQDALNITIQQHNTAIAKLLICHSPQLITMKDSKNDCPIHQCAFYNSIKIAKFILTKNPQCARWKNADNKTAYDIAEKRGHTKLTHILYRYTMQHPQQRKKR